jgi:hypothetical protein
VKETDLYPPLKRFLTAQGYEVKGEVGDCDVLAVRGDEPPVVVELKLTLNLTLLLQAVDRLSLSGAVYLGVPATNRTLATQRKRVLRLLRMLGLGLIAIDLQRDRVEVVLDPGPYRGPQPSTVRRQRLLGEFVKRVGDPNAGGADRRKGRVTAYRQRALAIAKHLRQHGPTKASVVAQALSDPQARAVLYRDVYGWFDRLGKGIYDLSPRGRLEVR